MNGILLSRYGHIDGNKERLALDSGLPLLRARMDADPKHYGLLRIHVSSVTAFSSRGVFRLAHGYKNTPSFFVAWHYPAGAGFELTKYGVGDVEIYASGGVAYIRFYTTRTHFIVEVDNTSNGDALTNQYIECRYFVFANDFTKA